MKKIIVTLTIFLSALTLSSFAADTKPARDGNVAPAVLKNFNASFASASEVAWTVSDNMYKAQFSLNGQYITAYYNNEGDLMGMTRNLASTQLPLTLQTRLKEELSEYWISDLFEVANNEGSSYYVTLEDADNKIVLRSSSNNEWSVYRKQRK